MKKTIILEKYDKDTLKPYVKDGVFIVNFPKNVLSFECNELGLLMLDGCPETVKFNFNCSDNKLTSLKGGPKEVGGQYLCYNNYLTTLQGCPYELNYLAADNNNLIDLQGAPRIIKNIANFNYNKLKNLKGSLKEIDSLSIVGNDIENFDGLPKIFGTLYYNGKLTKEDIKTEFEGIFINDYKQLKRERKKYEILVFDGEIYYLNSELNGLVDRLEL